MAIGTSGVHAIYFVDRDNDPPTASSQFKEFTLNCIQWRVTKNINELGQFDAKFVGLTSAQRAYIVEGALVYILSGQKLVGKFVCDKPKFNIDYTVDIKGYESTGSSTKVEGGTGSGRKRKLYTEIVGERGFEKEQGIEILYSSGDPKGILKNENGDVILERYDGSTGGDTVVSISLTNENGMEALDKVATESQKEWWLDYGTNDASPFSEVDKLHMADYAGDPSTVAYTFYLGGANKDTLFADAEVESESTINKTVIYGQDTNGKSISTEIFKATEKETTTATAIDAWLASDISQQTTTFSLFPGHNLSGKTNIIFKIDNEFIHVASVVTNTVTVTKRGYYSTYPSAHKGSTDVIWVGYVSGGSPIWRISFDVDDASALGVSPTQIRVGSELMSVFGIAGDTFTVQNRDSAYLTTNVYAHGKGIKVYNGAYDIFSPDTDGNPIATYGVKSVAVSDRVCRNVNDMDYKAQYVISSKQNAIKRITLTVIDSATIFNTIDLGDKIQINNAELIELLPGGPYTNVQLRFMGFEYDYGGNGTKLDIYCNDPDTRGFTSADISYNSSMNDVQQFKAQKPTTDLTSQLLERVQRVSADEHQFDTHLTSAMQINCDLLRASKSLGCAHGYWCEGWKSWCHIFTDEGMKFPRGYNWQTASCTAIDIHTDSTSMDTWYSPDCLAMRLRDIRFSLFAEEELCCTTNPDCGLKLIIGGARYALFYDVCNPTCVNSVNVRGISDPRATPTGDFDAVNLRTLNSCVGPGGSFWACTATCLYPCTVGQNVIPNTSGCIGFIGCCWTGIYGCLTMGECLCASSWAYTPCLRGPSDLIIDARSNTGDSCICFFNTGTCDLVALVPGNAGVNFGDAIHPWGEVVSDAGCFINTWTSYALPCDATSYLGCLGGEWEKLYLSGSICAPTGDNLLHIGFDSGGLAELEIVNSGAGQANLYVDNTICAGSFLCGSNACILFTTHTDCLQTDCIYRCDATSCIGALGSPFQEIYGGCIVGTCVCGTTCMITPTIRSTSFLAIGSGTNCVVPQTAATCLGSAADPWCKIEGVIGYFNTVLPRSTTDEVGTNLNPFCTGDFCTLYAHNYAFKTGSVSSCICQDANTVDIISGGLLKMEFGSSCIVMRDTVTPCGLSICMGTAAYNWAAVYADCFCGGSAVYADAADTAACYRWGVNGAPAYHTCLQMNQGTGMTITCSGNIVTFCSTGGGGTLWQAPAAGLLQPCISGCSIVRNGAACVGTLGCAWCGLFANCLVTNVLCNLSGFEIVFCEILKSCVSNLDMNGNYICRVGGPIEVDSYEAICVCGSGYMLCLCCSKVGIIEYEPGICAVLKVEESPDVWFNDRGTGTTNECILYDCIFNKVTEPEKKVFVTPITSNSGGWHVIKDEKGFSVWTERPFSFDYQVSAIRKGMQHLRWIDEVQNRKLDSMNTFESYVKGTNWR